MQSAILHTGSRHPTAWATTAASSVCIGRKLERQAEPALWQAFLLFTESWLNTDVISTRTTPIGTSSVCTCRGYMPKPKGKWWLRCGSCFPNKPEAKGRLRWRRDGEFPACEFTTKIKSHRKDKQGAGVQQSNREMVIIHSQGKLEYTELPLHIISWGILTLLWFNLGRKSVLSQFRLLSREFSSSLRGG